jgi:hypothetical protein
LIFNEAVKQLENQRIQVQKALQDSFEQNSKIFSQIEGNLQDNEKECEKISKDLNVTLDRQESPDSS